jgi:hypothetical protein
MSYEESDQNLVSSHISQWSKSIKVIEEKNKYRGKYSEKKIKNRIIFKILSQKLLYFKKNIKLKY